MLKFLIEMDLENTIPRVQSL